MTTPEKIARGLKAFEEAKAAHERKDFAEAARLFQLALALMPNHPNVLLAYGKLAEEVPDWKAAEKIYRKIGELRPDSNFEAALATTIFKQERWAECIPLYERHLSKHPETVEAYLPLAAACAHENRWEESLAAARKALASMWTDDALDTEINALYHLGRIDELDSLLPKALAEFPEHRGLRSLNCLHKLKSGEFEEGFRYFSDLRWRNNQRSWSSMKERGKVTEDTWDGQPFEGTLIIHAEQGVGDELLLSSMFDDLIASGQETIIECDQRLIPLYSRVYPSLRFIPRRKDKKDYKPDDDRPYLTITALDAASVFRPTRGHFPATRRSWLKADPERVNAIREEYRSRWPGKKLIGLSWKSTRTMEGARKDVTMAELEPVLRQHDCAFICLQYGDVSEEQRQVADAGHELYVDPNVDTKMDLDAFAAQVAALDLVISISNTTVHIAGAQGVPCWMMLPKTRPVLWYWGYRGETTPWYPSVRIHRCSEENDWRGVIDQVASELAKLPAPPA